MIEEFKPLLDAIIGSSWGLRKDGKLVAGEIRRGRKIDIGKFTLVYHGNLTPEKLKMLTHLFEAMARCEEHQRNSVALEKIREVVVKLSSSVGWKETLKVLLRTIKSLIAGKFFSIFLVNRKEKTIYSILSLGYEKNEKELLHLKIGRGLVGWVIEKGKPLNIRDVRKEPRYFEIKKETRSELVVPIRVGKRIIGAINVEDTKVGTYTEREEKLLEAFASIAGVVIERARLYRSLLEHRLTLKELEVARKIQTHFLPKKTPSFKGFKIYGRTYPARRVGGDYYNFFRRSRDSLLFILADVSGKGIPAALLTSFLHSAMVIFKDGTDLLTLAKKLNQLVYSQTEANQFITGILGEVQRQGTISYVNFGHNYPILIKEKKAALVEGSDLVMGIKPDADFTLRKLILPPGSALYLYTDGAVEENCGGQEFGTENLMRIIEENWEHPPGVVRSIISEMNQRCGRERDDDITILGIVHVGS